MAIQVFRDAGIAKAETVRKNGDGSTVFNVTLADGIDHTALKIVNGQTCAAGAPGRDQVGKGVSHSKGGMTG